jgi:hypothetical protein
MELGVVPCLSLIRASIALVSFINASMACSKLELGGGSYWLLSLRWSRLLRWIGYVLSVFVWKIWVIIPYEVVRVYGLSWLSLLMALTCSFPSLWPGILKWHAVAAWSDPQHIGKSFVLVELVALYRPSTCIIIWCGSWSSLVSISDVGFTL